MRSKSYPHPHKTAHAVGWNAMHWIAGLVCGLLLSFVAPSAAHASTVTPLQRPADGLAAAGVSVAANPANVPDSAEGLEFQAPWDSGNRRPCHSIVLCLDPYDDDDCSRGRLSSGSSRLSVEQALSLRRPSRAPEGSLTPYGRSAAGQFLTESVRRM